MGSYIDKNLLSDEKIIFRTHRHWIVFWTTILWLFIAGVLWLMPALTSLVGLVAFVVAIIYGCFNFINYQMSELAVTDMRVLVKVGWIGRYSLETNLQNIASVEVDQSPLGRLLGYGTVKIFDTGHMQSPFSYIYKPFEFRKAVLELINRRYPAP